MLSMFTSVNMNLPAGTWEKIAEHADFYCTLQYEKPAVFKCYFILLYYQRRRAKVNCERKCDNRTEVKASSVDVDGTAGVQWTEVPVCSIQQPGT